MSKLISNWKKLAGLKRSQWRVIVQVPYVLLLTWVRFRRGGYQKTLAGISEQSRTALSPDLQVMRAGETAYALSVAIKFGPWRPRCMMRSLALGWYLARSGIPFELRIGVPYDMAMMQADEAIGFSAHAWVEHAGVVLNDRADIASDFRVFETGSGPT